LSLSFVGVKYTCRKWGSSIRCKCFRKEIIPSVEYLKNKSNLKNICNQH
jgi:hypothetical protein